MKWSRGASGLFYLIVGIAFIIILLIIPYPHYNPENSSWYMGASIARRLSGAKDPGLPLEVVFEKVTKGVLTSPLEITCTENKDCVSYPVVNKCQVYCGNTSPANKSSITKLNNQRICDPAAWRRPTIECACIHGSCVNLH